MARPFILFVSKGPEHGPWQDLLIIFLTNRRLILVIIKNRVITVPRESTLKLVFK